MSVASNKPAATEDPVITSPDSASDDSDNVDDDIQLGEAWLEIDEELASRHKLLVNSYNRLKSYVPDAKARLKLAATDVFVEKAQHRLTSRANKLMWAGIATGILTVCLLVGAAWVVFSRSPSALLDETYNHYVLTMAIIKAISLGGFVGGVAYFIGGLSSALLHESLLLMNRRHALRFGRLAVYLQGGTVDPKMLHELFRWNEEFGTAFKNIKGAELKKGGLAGLVETPTQTLGAATKLVEAIKAAEKKSE